MDAAEGRHCMATCAQEKKVIRVKCLALPIHRHSRPTASIGHDVAQDLFES